MKRNLLFVLSLFLCFQAYSQEVWEGRVRQRQDISASAGMVDIADSIVLKDRSGFDVQFDRIDKFGSPLPFTLNNQPKSFILFGTGRFDDYPYLLTTRSTSFGLRSYVGPLTMVVSVTANNYTGPFGPFMQSTNQFGLGGQLIYSFSDNFQMVLFGQFYNVNPIFSVAAYPFLNTTRYGGYIDITGDWVGVQLGAQRYFNPYTNQWELAPIISPKFKVSDNVFITLPVGGLVKNGIEKLSHKDDPPPPPSRRR